MPLFSSPAMRGPRPAGRPQGSVGGKTVAGSGVASSSGPQGRGKGTRGLGLGKSNLKRHSESDLRSSHHRKILKDNIMAVTKSDIRRLARRGGVKRISGMIYQETRDVLRKYLSSILNDCVLICEHSKRKTVTVTDVIWSLKRQGRPIYGFDQNALSKKPDTKKRY
ncbi:Histone H4 [Lachnellula hyalina]|uniref:Histone H4 n=1 Tax=Lachnellula hyalina TaxID=1316788 RepID=A0A8H8U4I1_9HELO|nr:Histone H4 [Lachnellula hyalina]TVY30223.1 Histone H4 [Lachnellula hyalina]